jgi:aspartyl aminopeptidase
MFFNTNSHNFFLLSDHRKQIKYHLMRNRSERHIVDVIKRHLKSKGFNLVEINQKLQWIRKTFFDKEAAPIVTLS